MRSSAALQKRGKRAEPGKVRRAGRRGKEVLPAAFSERAGSLFQPVVPLPAGGRIGGVQNLTAAAGPGPGWALPGIGQGALLLPARREMRCASEGQ